MPSSPDVAPVRSRATVVGAWLEGWRRAIRAPGVALAAWALTVLVTLPLAALLREDVAAHLGSSAMAEDALHGWSQDWSGEFASEARDIAATLTREVLGATVTVATLSRIAEGVSLPPWLAGTVVVYLIIWIFLSGGIVDRLARARPLGAAMFLSLCGRYFGRLLRLALGAALAYWLLFGFVHPLLFGSVFDAWTRDATNEPRSLALLAALYAVFFVLLGIVSLVIDFTRVRLVVEDRRSTLAALAAGLRFVRRRFWRTVGLYALNIAGQVVIARVWFQIAVGADGPDVVALLVAQLYLVARIWSRMAFLGSEAVFYQGELAHATYTAAPLPRWPDSATAEGIRNLRSGQ